MAVNASSAGLTILLSSNAVFAVKKKKRHREENEIKRGGEREKERVKRREKWGGRERDLEKESL